MKLCLYLVLICQAFLLHGQTATEPVGTFDELSGSPFSTGNFPNSVAYSSILNGQLFAAVFNKNVLFAWVLVNDMIEKIKEQILCLVIRQIKM